MTTNDEFSNSDHELDALAESGSAKARETLADTTAPTGARGTVVGPGAEVSPAPTSSPEASDERADSVVPRMPDGAARAVPAEADEAGLQPESDWKPALHDSVDMDGPDLDDIEHTARTAPALAATAVAREQEPPVGRYALPRNHRVAADTKGRTLSEREFKSLSRRSLLTGAVGAAAAFMGWRTIQNRPVDDRIPDVLRDVHQANESIWRGLFREGAEAPTFDYSESSMMRINGRHGIREELDLASWELVVVGRNGEQLGVHGVDELRSMEQVELTVEHKCVEGWAHIVTWGGVRFSDFLERFYPEEAAARFVGLATPDNQYRVGLDMDSMLHSQTLLALDLQREPLSDQHGAPVRLATPLKYGIKQIKRIGTIEFSDTQPDGDYWATRGYDWYAGL